MIAQGPILLVRLPGRYGGSFDQGLVQVLPQVFRGQFPVEHADDSESPFIQLIDGPQAVDDEKPRGTVGVRRQYGRAVRAERNGEDESTWPR